MFSRKVILYTAGRTARKWLTHAAQTAILLQAGPSSERYAELEMLYYSAFVLLFAAATLFAQEQVETLRSNSTLVLVPTLVTTTSEGNLAFTMKAEDFSLSDDGVPQQLHLEGATHEPVAMVVLMQTGGAAPKEFSNYAGISVMLENALSAVPYRVSLVTFDSHPEDRWPFTNDANNLRDAFVRPMPGNGGDAVLEAVTYGLDWFEDQHPPGRRIILLISDQHFHGSDDMLRQITQRLAETNTTIYSLSFNAQKTYLKDELKHSSPPNPPLFFAPDHGAILGTFNLGRPLYQALKAMQGNAAQGIAALSGGTYMPFNNRKDLEQHLLAFANDLNNRYILSFQPSNSKEGLHSITVTLPQHPELQVIARAAYWHAASPEKIYIPVKTY